MKSQEDVTVKPQVSAHILGDGARLLIVVAMSLIIYFGARELRDIIVPVMAAGFLAIISYSITDIFRRVLRFPHWLAVIATMLIDFGLIFGIISLINFLISDFITILQGDITVRFAEKFDVVMSWMREHNLEEHARSLVKSPQDIFDSQQIIKFTQTLTGQVLGFMSTSALVLILMTFFLGEAPLFHRNLDKLPHRSDGKSQFLHAIMGIQRYLFIKTVACVCTGLLSWGLCFILNVPFAFLWGVLAAVLNYIPTFGSIVAAIPPILLGLILNDWSTGFLVALGYLAINGLIGNGIEPLFLGRQFGISTSIVLLSVITWGWAFGPVGMLLAVPITVLIKLALEHSRDLSWIAVMISDTSANDRAMQRLHKMQKMNPNHPSD